MYIYPAHICLFPAFVDMSFPPIAFHPNCPNSSRKGDRAFFASAANASDSEHLLNYI